MRNQSGTHRCSICNTVNSPFIETNIGDYKIKMSFTEDPKDSMHEICIECIESIEEVRSDYHFDDEEKEKTND